MEIQVFHMTAAILDPWKDVSFDLELSSSLCPAFWRLRLKDNNQGDEGGVIVFDTGALPRKTQPENRLAVGCASSRAAESNLCSENVSEKSSRPVSSGRVASAVRCGLAGLACFRRAAPPCAETSRRWLEEIIYSISSTYSFMRRSRA